MANFAGGGLTALVQFLMVPFYLKMIGTEAYGLFGVQAVFLMLARFCDFGLGTALNRLVAQARTGEQENIALRISSIVVLSSFFAILGVALVGISASFVASNWIKNVTLSDKTVAQSIVSMGISVGCIFVQGVISGALLGSNAHRLVNVVKAGAAIFGAIGAIIILGIIDNSVSALFFWLALVSILQTIIMLICCRFVVLRGYGWRLSWRAAGWVLINTGGIGGIHLTGLILGSLDKIILSGILDLQEFGYYMLASTVAGSLSIVISPLFNALFPRMSSLAMEKDRDGLTKVYRFGVQLMNVVLSPLAFTATCFAVPMLKAWTGSSETAVIVAPMVGLMVVGSYINGLMFMPYALQLASHCHVIGIVVNVFLVLIMVPSLLIAVHWGGALWASGVWLEINLLYFIIALPWTHRRVLPGIGFLTFFRDFCLPAGGALSAIVVLSLFLSLPMNRIATFVVLGGIIFFGAGVSMVCSSEIRNYTIIWFRQLRKRG